MGKRLQGAALRAKKRQKALVEELQEQQAEQVARQSVIDQTDQELFVLDTLGDHVEKQQGRRRQRQQPSKTRTIQQQQQEKSDKTIRSSSSSVVLLSSQWSNQEKREINKLVQRHSKDELISMVQAGQKLYHKGHHLQTHGIRKDRGKGGGRSHSQVFDLWNDNEDNNNMDPMVTTTKTNNMQQQTSNHNNNNNKKGIRDSIPGKACDHEKQTGTKPRGKDDDDDKSNNKNSSLEKTNNLKQSDDSQSLKKETCSSSSKISAVRSQRRPRRHVIPGVSVDVAKGGQSYRPDPQQHQTVLRQALTVEERRNQAEIDRNTPISPGMSEETKALLLGDSDDDSDDDDDDDNDSCNENDKVEMELNVFHKQRDKLTRAQRNKRKRLRQEEQERMNIKKRRIMDNQVYSITRIKKQVNKEKEQEQKRQEQKRLHVQEKVTMNNQQLGTEMELKVSQQDPEMAPTYPVVLTNEMTQQRRQQRQQQQDCYGLRTIIPKGNLITDRMVSYALRNLTPQLPFATHNNKNKNNKKTRQCKQSQQRRKKKKVKGGKEWEGDTFVIIK